MKIKLGTNVAVFVLFFGVALLEAVRDADYAKAGLWLLVGLVFLFGDSITQTKS